MSKIIGMWVLSLTIVVMSLVADLKHNFQLNLFSRSGAIVVCISVILPLIRFRYGFLNIGSGTASQIYKDIGVPAPSDIKSSRFKNINKYSTLTLAVCGTLIAAYGDLVKTLFVSKEIAQEQSMGHNRARDLTRLQPSQPASATPNIAR